MEKNINNIPNEHEYSSMNTEEKIMWHADQYSVPHSLSKEEAFKKLMHKIAEPDSTKTRIVRLWPSWQYMSATAAVILILLTGSWFIMTYKPVEDVVANKGHITDCRLPDGSMVILNADSKISYIRSNFHKKRQLKLDGEAFFDIQKGSTFTVSTTLGDIRVLGTSFNVYARENFFKVSCFTGRVMVTSDAGSHVVLPMETASIENNKLIVHHDENLNATVEWRNGEFSFENASLNMVFSELERQFNVTFVLPEIDNKLFTGSFSNKDLVNALDIVCIPMGLTYEIGSNSKIFIRKKAN
jgi:transmembrane sensor